jgi:hypothetical protein
MKPVSNEGKNTAKQDVDRCVRQGSVHGIWSTSKELCAACYSRPCLWHGHSNTIAMFTSASPLL